MMTDTNLIIETHIFLLHLLICRPAHSDCCSRCY